MGGVSSRSPQVRGGWGAMQVHPEAVSNARDSSNARRVVFW